MNTRKFSTWVLVSFFSVVPLAHAATYTVNSLGDTGGGNGFSGDLRYCITQANANSPGPNVIKFQSGLVGAIHLTAYLPELLNKLSIQGLGANNLTVYGYGTVVSVGSGASIFLSGLTLTGGLGKGGGMYISSGSTVILSKIAVSGNASPMGSPGGGIYNNGVLRLNNSTISGNSASVAAGILNGGKLALNNSTISANIAELAAGGIMGPNSEGACTSRNTILAGNTSAGDPRSSGRKSGDQRGR